MRIIFALIGLIALASAQTVKNTNENCWFPCLFTEGRCDFCGAGYCCREGFRGNGCTGEMGCKDKHCCVDYKEPTHEGDLSGCQKIHPGECERHPECGLVDGKCEGFKVVKEREFCLPVKFTVSTSAKDARTCASLVAHTKVCTGGCFLYADGTHYTCECLVDTCKSNIDQAIFAENKVVDYAGYTLYQVTDPSIVLGAPEYPLPSGNDLTNCHMHDNSYSCNTDENCRYHNGHCYPYEVLHIDDFCWHRKHLLGNNVPRALDCASLTYHSDLCPTNVFMYADIHQRCECMVTKCNQLAPLDKVTMPYPGYNAYRVLDRNIKPVYIKSMGYKPKVVASQANCRDMWPNTMRYYTATSMENCAYQVLVGDCKCKRFVWGKKHNQCSCFKTKECQIRAFHMSNRPKFWSWEYYVYDIEESFSTDPNNNPEDPYRFLNNHDFSNLPKDPSTEKITPMPHTQGGNNKPLPGRVGGENNEDP